jgi:hypothetical protein
LYRRLSGSKRRSAWVWEISPLSGFDPHTVWPRTSCCTDYAVPNTLHYMNFPYFVVTPLYRVSQEECAIFRESVPYVKLYRYNPKHLHPNLNGYGDNDQRNLKVWLLLLAYWLSNTYPNWQEYVASVILISVLNIKVTCVWHKVIQMNDKNSRHTLVLSLVLQVLYADRRWCLIVWRQS